MQQSKHFFLGSKRVHNNVNYWVNASVAIGTRVFGKTVDSHQAGPRRNACDEAWNTVDVAWAAFTDERDIETMLIFRCPPLKIWTPFFALWKSTTGAYRSTKRSLCSINILTLLPFVISSSTDCKVTLLISSYISTFYLAAVLQLCTANVDWASDVRNLLPFGTRCMHLKQSSLSVISQSTCHCGHAYPGQSPHRTIRKIGRWESRVQRSTSRYPWERTEVLTKESSHASMKAQWYMPIFGSMSMKNWKI